MQPEKTLHFFLIVAVKMIYFHNRHKPSDAVMSHYKFYLFPRVKRIKPQRSL